VTAFAQPLWLLLLLPVLLLPLQSRLTGRNALAVARVGREGAPFSLRVALAWVPGALRVVGLALVVLALARPQLTRRETVVESEGLDIVLALDTSGSMRAEDLTIGMLPVDRLGLAKSVIAKFVEARPHDRIGLVVFGEEAFTQSPLTLDHETLIDMLERVEIGVAGSEGTAIGTGLAVAAKRLKDLEAPGRLIILLTDGRNNAGRVSPLEAADAAAALDIKVYTVGVGAEQRSIFGMLAGDGLDERLLTEMAERTEGRFFRATDAGSLQRIYETIDELEPSPAEVSQIVDQVELFRTFLVPGLVVLVTELLLSATWLRRGP
jgi:Ca-activated chloride channel family protein